MNINFYHGTSNFFLGSIRDRGLGAINPNYDYKFLELLRFLYLKAEIHLLDDKDYIKIRSTTDCMANQKPLIREINGITEKHNFKHSKIYVASFEFRAVVYAVNTKFGSEILSRAIELYKLLKKRLGSLNIPKQIDYCGIESIAYNIYKPILIRINSLTSKDLNTEFGEPADNLIDEILKLRLLLDDAEFYTAIQYCNFEIKSAIEPSRLEFFRIWHLGSPFDLDFKYQLEKI